MVVTSQHRIGNRLAPPAGEEAADIHVVIDNAIPPALTVAPGEVVAFDCPGLPLPPRATIDDLASIDPERPHTIIGPVAISGAEPGDTLVVEILEIELIQDYGHTLFVPGHGLLPDDFGVPHVHNFELPVGAAYTELRPGVRIPLNPFCGILGVMPQEPGVHPTTPPRSTGGNLDIRHLVPGTTVFLPVAVPGALFFCGDGHAAQGDGEVCVTGLETSVRATLRLGLDKTRTIPAPQFLVRKVLGVDAGAEGYYATSAPGPDLYECSQQAIRSMIEYLVDVRGLTREEAYVLCSLAVDLKINEIVDAPNWLVSAYLPLTVFAER